MGKEFQIMPHVLLEDEIEHKLKLKENWIENSEESKIN